MSLVTDNLVHTISLERVLDDGGNDWGDGNYAAAVDVLTFFEYFMESVPSFNGTIVTSEARIFSDEEIRVKDRITYEGKTFQVKHVRRLNELGNGGISHYQSYLDRVFQ